MKEGALDLSTVCVCLAKRVIKEGAPGSLVSVLRALEVTFVTAELRRGGHNSLFYTLCYEFFQSCVKNESASGISLLKNQNVGLYCYHYIP